MRFIIERYLIKDIKKSEDESIESGYFMPFKSYII